MAILIPQARQRVLFVETVAGSGTFVMVGCATSINMSQDAEIVVNNCRAGREKSYGSDIDIKMSINGVHKVYTSTDAAANVSLEDIKAWQRNSLKKKYRTGLWDFQLAEFVVGSYKEEGTAMIASATSDAGETGNETYSVSLEFDTAGFTSAVVTV